MNLKEIFTDIRPITKIIASVVLLGTLFGYTQNSLPDEVTFMIIGGATTVLFTPKD